MLVLNAGQFVRLVKILNSERANRDETGPLSRALLKKLSALCDSINKILMGFQLSHSIKVVDNVLRLTGTHQKFRSGIEQLAASIELELEDRKFYGPLPSLEQYYDQTELFGAKVFKNFSSANNDIYESGMCLALERGTACVLHLMRVMESGLAALAHTLGVNKQNDWGAYLRAIEAELEKRYKTSGARSPDEQFYAASALTFDQVRRAWRNPTMHVENNYSPERAKEILEAVRSFMNHLATKISE